MTKILLKKIIMSGFGILFFSLGAFDVFNIGIGIATLPSHVCTPIELSKDISAAVKLLKKQNCDLVFDSKSATVDLIDDRTRQLQLSYLIYHNQQVFEKSPYSTIRRFQILDRVRNGDLDGDYSNLDSSIRIEDKAPFLATVHEVNHSLVRQVKLSSFLNHDYTLNQEQKYFTQMLGSEYSLVIKRQLSSEDSINAFGSDYPVMYELFKGTKLAAAEIVSTLVEQYFNPVEKRTILVTTKLQKLESFTDKRIRSGYHSNPTLQAIFANPDLNNNLSNFCFDSDAICINKQLIATIKKVDQLEQLIVQLNSISTVSPKTSYIYMLKFVTNIMIAATLLFLSFVMFTLRIKYGRKTKSKNKKAFTLI
jgi:hypothetical protein